MPASPRLRLPRPLRAGARAPQIAPRIAPQLALSIVLAVAGSACTEAQFKDADDGRLPDVAHGAVFELAVRVSGLGAEADDVTLATDDGADGAIEEVDRVPGWFDPSFTALLRCVRAGDATLLALEGDRELARVAVTCVPADGLVLVPYAPRGSDVVERVRDEDTRADEALPTDAPVRLLATREDLAGPTDGAAFFVVPHDAQGAPLVGRAPFTAVPAQGNVSAGASADEALLTSEPWARVTMVPRVAEGTDSLRIEGLDVALAQPIAVVPTTTAQELEILTARLHRVRDGELTHAWLRARDDQGLLFHALGRWGGPALLRASLDGAVGDLLTFERGPEMSEVRAALAPGVEATAMLPIQRAVSVGSAAAASSSCASTTPSSLLGACALALLLRARARRRA